MPETINTKLRRTIQSFLLTHPVRTHRQRTQLQKCPTYWRLREDLCLLQQILDQDQEHREASNFSKKAQEFSTEDRPQLPLSMVNPNILDRHKGFNLTTFQSKMHQNSYRQYYYQKPAVNFRQPSFSSLDECTLVEVTQPLTEEFESSHHQSSPIKQQLKRIVAYDRDVTQIMEEIMDLPHDQFVWVMKTSDEQPSNWQYEINDNSPVLNFLDEMDRVFRESKALYEHLQEHAASQRVKSNDSQINWSEIYSEDLQRKSLLTKALTQNQGTENQGISANTQQRKSKKSICEKMKGQENQQRRKEVKVSRKETCGSCSSNCRIF